MNGWKGQLPAHLYHETDAALAGTVRAAARSGSPRRSRRSPKGSATCPTTRCAPSSSVSDARYRLSFATDVQRRHATLVRAAEAEGRSLTLDFQIDRFRDRTEMLLFTPDHPGLSAKIAGAIALSGASIVDARIFTTADGMALDSFGLQNADDRTAVAEPKRLERIRRNIEQVLEGRICSIRRWPAVSSPARTEVFLVGRGC